MLLHYIRWLIQISIIIKKQTVSSSQYRYFLYTKSLNGKSIKVHCFFAKIFFYAYFIRCQFQHIISHNNDVSVADTLLPEIAAPLFENEDMINGIERIMTHCPGKVVFNGRKK